MATTDHGGVTIAYETHGDPANPTVLLVMGLGEQLTAWHPELCEELVARGYHVVRFDNRDVGLSQRFDDAGVPNVLGALTTSEAPDPPYTLDDMAADAISVLDTLGVESAHVAGASMGGMIAQAIAINHGPRVLSLTSIMATTGNPDVPRGTPKAYQALLAPPAPPQVEAVIERGLQVWNILAGPGYPTPPELRSEWIRRDFERSYYPYGVARQLYAIVAHGDRSDGLRQLEVPTVVLHGSADPLIPLAGGEDTANVIPGAELRVIDGWGHDFPLELVLPVANAITAAAERA